MAWVEGRVESVGTALLSACFAYAANRAIGNVTKMRLIATTIINSISVNRPDFQFITLPNNAGSKKRAQGALFCPSTLKRSGRRTCRQCIREGSSRVGSGTASRRTGNRRVLRYGAAIGVATKNLVALGGSGTDSRNGCALVKLDLGIDRALGRESSPHKASACGIGGNCTDCVARSPRTDVNDSRH